MEGMVKRMKKIEDGDVRLEVRDEYEKVRGEREKIERRESMDER